MISRLFKSVLLERLCAAAELSEREQLHYGEYLFQQFDRRLIRIRLLKSKKKDIRID